jgi:hypothetical protein
MNKNTKLVFSLSAIAISFAAVALQGCNYTATQSADSKIAQQQEKNLAIGDAEVPPPHIVNWNEKRMLKLIQEKRDQMDLPTWTYTKNMDGKYTFVCESIGYGIPYNTRANNPQHYEFVSTSTGVNMGSGGGGYYTDAQGNTIWGEHTVMAQPEPNGLFIPDSAKGTWNLCRDPRTGKSDVTYQEEDVSVFPYQLPEKMVEGYNGEDASKHASLTQAGN